MTILNKMADLPPPAEAEKAQSTLNDALAGEGAGQLSQLVRENPNARTLLLSVFGASPFLSAIISRDPDYAWRCLKENPQNLLTELEDNLDKDLGGTDEQAVAMTILRRVKARGALLVALGDVSGYWDVLEAAYAMSTLADRLIQAAIRWLLAEQADKGVLLPANPDLPDQSCFYTVLAMGKLGAHELNFSSDIDLIVLFDPENAPLAEGKDPGKIFIRLTRALVKLLQEPTRDGYVFRTDLRLRPDPGATQVAISVMAAAQYYLAMGQNWERAAMIRARPVAGDIKLGREFLDELKPFIWRKYLDFAAIADVHAMKRQIHAHKGHGKITVSGHNIKLGRGGIREIEFFVQTQQLIAGGRQPELRVIRTLEAMSALTRAKWIEPQAEQELSEAYIFLRFIEHRIQMQRDEQTHSLPSDEEGLARLAAFAGFASLNEFSEKLIHHLTNVQTHYAALFEETPGLSSDAGSLVFVGGEDDPATLETLSEMGFPEPAEVSRLVRGWHVGRYPASRSEKARERLTEIVPALLEAFARSASPGAAFLAFDRFLSRLPAGVQLFSLLGAYPHLLKLLAEIMGTSPRLAIQLSHRPRTLEAVLDPEFFSHIPDREEYAADIGKMLERAQIHEERLDVVRVFGQEHKFRIGVRLLSGTMDAHEAGAAYADLASACIEALLQTVGDELAVRHGRMKNGRASVLAMGKLGGREMSASSDLDLILIYDYDEDESLSDGEKPLTANQYYSRLTQRLISALTAPTAEGALYEVDMRLRPSGRAGPLATSIQSFASYQATSAWIWEKLALTRARPVAGPDSLCGEIKELIAGDLQQPRDPVMTARGVIDMRSRIAEEKGDDNPWDIKQVRGGIIDLEFIAQYLQLVHAHEHPEILSVNTADALTRLVEAKAVSDTAATTLFEAVYLYGIISQILRLCLDGLFDPASAPKGLKSLLTRVTSAPDLKVLEAQMRETQQAVHAIFRDTIEKSARKPTDS